MKIQLADVFSPMALFSTGLRKRKRRITIGNALIGIAILAVVFALLVGMPKPLTVVGLVVL